MNSEQTTQYGALTGITAASYYRSGPLKSCMFNERNVLQTPCGELVPQYRTAEFGERQKKHRAAVAFFENEQIKSVALDKLTPLKTPIGSINAELVTFYQDGAVNRVFPLNGLIDGYWTEKNEWEMAENLSLDLPVGKIQAKVISLHFYPSGALKSVTLWPGERVIIQTPAGPMLIRTGFSLYENGGIRSVEPAQPTELPTPIGLIQAFDPEVIGMHADQNSLQFSPEGILTSIKTVHTGIRIENGGLQTEIEPHEMPSHIDPTQMMTVPMEIRFQEQSIQIKTAQSHHFPIEDHAFSTFERKQVLRACCGGCSGGDDCCGGC